MRAALAAAAAGWLLAAAAVAGGSTYRAAFTETRALAGAASPLVLHGTVAFEPGRELDWHITRPYDYRLRIRDGRIEEHLPDGSTQTAPLAKTPWAHALFNLFTALFGGDTGALARYFEVTRSARGFTLVPRSEVLAKSVRRIVVTGKPVPETVTIEQSGGSRTRLSFQARTPLPPAASAAAPATGG